MLYYAGSCRKLPHRNNMIWTAVANWNSSRNVSRHNLWIKWLRLLGCAINWAERKQTLQPLQNQKWSFLELTLMGEVIFLLPSMKLKKKNIGLIIIRPQKHFCTKVKHFILLGNDLNLDLWPCTKSRSYLISLLMQNVEMFRVHTFCFYSLLHRLWMWWDVWYSLHQFSCIWFRCKM